MDLGTPVLEQLVVRHLLERASSVLEPRRVEITQRRDHLLRLLREHLPRLGSDLPTVACRCGRSSSNR